MEKYWAMSHGLLHGSTPKAEASKKSDSWVTDHGLLNRRDASPTLKELCNSHYLDLYDEIAKSDSRQQSSRISDSRAEYATGGAVSDVDTAPNWMQGAPSNNAPEPFKKGGGVYDSGHSSKSDEWIEWTGHSGHKTR